MSAGLSALILFGLFFLFIFLTVPIGISIGLSIIIYLAISGMQPFLFVATNLFTAVDSFPLMAIPFFVLAGALMEGGGLSKRLIGAADAFVGHFTGGFGVVTVVACAFFGAISGSAPATVSAIGAIMLPAMIDRGYDKTYAVALIAASGCLGVIVPPSIPMVVYGVATGASVGSLFMAGFGPAVVFAGCLIVLNYITCKKNGWAGNGMKFSIKRCGKALWEGIWALMVPIIILGGIYGGFFTPTEAAVVAVIYGFFAGMFIYRELDFKKIWECLASSAVTTGTVLIACSTGTVLARILTIARIPDLIINGLLSVSDSGIIIMLLINIFLLIVGMVMDSTAAMLILAPILAPIAEACGVNSVWFGIIMVVNLAIGFITPPVGVNLFVATGMSGVPFEKLSKKIVPFVIILLVAQLIITYCEPLVMTIPNLINN